MSFSSLLALGLAAFGWGIPSEDEERAPRIEKLLAASREALAEREARVLAVLPPAIQGLNQPWSSGEARLAADSLRQLGAAVLPHLFPYLERSSGASPFLATNVARLIGELATPSYLPELVELIQGKKDDVAHNALLALAPHATPAHSSAIAALLERKSPETQQLALAVLRKIQDPRVADKVVPLLTAQSDDVRGAAVDTLIALEDEQGIEAMRDRIVQEDDPEVFVKIARFFADRNVATLGPQVLRRAENRQLGLNHRIAMIRLLAEMKYENARQPLDIIAGSTGENFAVREEAAYASYKLGSKVGANVILNRWKAAIEDRRESWSNWRGLAMVYKNLGEEKNAIESLDKAIKLKLRVRNADVNDLRLEMARCYSRMGRTDPAYRIFKRYELPITDEVKVDPELANLRETKEWEDLLRHQERR